MRRSHLGIGAVWLGTAAIAVACGGGDSSAPPGNPDAAVTADGSMADDATDTPDGTGAPDAEHDTGTTDAGSGEASTDAGSGEASSDAGDAAPSRPVSANIVVDQFGYRLHDEKIAVVRKPSAGFDVGDASFAPGATYALVDANTGAKLVEKALTPWNSGAVDPSSGDIVWRFDFSSVVTAGDYYVLDEASGAQSATFRIADGVYADPLVQATRILYYQRDGIVKAAANAGASWSDGYAHAQNSSCTLLGADGGGLRDLHGGWFEAGDQDKYAGPAASDIIELLRAYAETPSAFGDATNIPESGNGVPDVLDEAKWGLDWLGRMQSGDGSVLTVVSNGGASPPSADASPCVYGPASASTTWTAAAAFAYGALVFKSATGVGTAYAGYADALAARAANAWTWASANPSVVFSNVPANLGTREQEVSASARVDKSVQAAAFLYKLTQTDAYRTFFDANVQYPAALDAFNVEPVETLLDYASTANATPATVATIVSTLTDLGSTSVNIASEVADTDPYLAYLPAYPRGSNLAKVGQANLFYDLGVVGSIITGDAGADAGGPLASGARLAERYAHYLHGVNPLGLAYLSNMGAHGAEKSLTRVFSYWFTPSSKWGAVTASQPGPPPGYLVVGPNSTYTWDGCCPSACGSTDLNALCGAAPPSPPASQPDQKSYLDFNAGYPLDSWQVSEPYNPLQTQYIRLLSKYAGN